MADWEHNNHFMCMGGASAAANNDVSFLKIFLTRILYGSSLSQYFVVGAPGAFFQRGKCIERLAIHFLHKRRFACVQARLFLPPNRTKIA